MISAPDCGAAASGAGQAKCAACAPGAQRICVPAGNRAPHFAQVPGNFAAICLVPVVAIFVSS
jgi:hypothetical protein